nr:MAG TPA: hypothetical protein [Caudoviricetes sp.]
MIKTLQIEVSFSYPTPRKARYRKNLRRKK